MALTDLFKKAKDSGILDKVKEIANDENTKKVVKAAGEKLAKNKNVKKAVSKVTKEAKAASKKVAKVAKSVGIDATSLMTLAIKNKDVVKALENLGLKKDSDPTSSVVQKLVGTLKSKINTAAGIKVEDKTFSSAVTKLLGNTKIKEQLEKISGTGVSAFIKKAVSAYMKN